MTDKTTKLILHFDNNGTDADKEELEQLTRQLREELMELDVESVEFSHAGELPEKAKAGVPIDWGTLLLTLAASGGVITTIINVLKSWLTRQERRSITLEINGDKLEVSGISSQKQQKLIDTWISQHS